MRAASPCPDRCRQGEVELLAGEHPAVVTGFFLRSVRVAGLPRLEAKAICKGPPDTLEVYSIARLSPSILLYLFKGRAGSITLRQKPDTVRLSTKGKSVVMSSQRALTITAATSAAFAKDMIPDQLEELTVDVLW